MTLANDIILIGGSAGSYNLLVDILSALPRKFSQAICIVIHRNPKFESKIEKSLSNQLGRKITSVMDKANIEANNVYFAPAGYHLLVEPDKSFALDLSDPINYSRPSIDVLFTSAAQVYRKNCIAFLLSGANHDGSQGLVQIIKHGGKGYAQNPKEALMSTMPQSALTLNNQVTKKSSNEILSFFKNI